MGPKRKVEAIMAKVYWKGSTLLAPVSPTMVTCGSWEKPNIITIAWTGIVNSQPPMTYISVRPSRYSYELLKETGEFVINLTLHSWSVRRTGAVCAPAEMRTNLLPAI